MTEEMTFQEKYRQPLEYYISGLPEILPLSHFSDKIAIITGDFVKRVFRGDWFGFIRWMDEDPYEYYDMLERESPK